VFPQEAGSYRPAVRPDRRRAFARELITASQAAVHLISSCVQHMPENSRNKRGRVLDAYAAWVRLSQGRLNADDPSAAGPREPPQIDPATLAAHPLTALALESLGLHATDEAAFDHAVDAVCELVRATVTATTSGGGSAVDNTGTDAVGVNGGIPPASMPLVQLLVPRVMALRPALTAAAGTDGADDDVAKGIARLFAEVGEAYVDLIATGAPDAIAPVEALLQVTAYPDTDIAAMSFFFWDRLSHVLMGRRGDPSGDTNGGPLEAEAERARRHQLFRPAYVHLIQNIMGRLRYPDGFEHWHREERQDFKRMRYAVADTLTEAAAVVGGAQALQIIAAPLQELLACADAAAPSPSFDWRKVEAALYCVRSISKEPPPPDDPLLASLLASLADLPAHPQLLYTAALTASAYSEWLSGALSCAPNPALLQRLFAVLHRALFHDDTDTRGAAALALKHLCDATAVHLAPFLEPLMQLYTTALTSTSTVAGAKETESSAGTGGGTEGAASSSRVGGPERGMDPDDVLQVIEGLCYVVSALPTEQADPVLTAMLQPIAAALMHAFPPAESAGPAAPDSGLIVLHFDRLATVMRHVAHPELVAGVFRELWPVVARGLERCGDRDERAAEHICRCIKYAFRTSRYRLTDLVAPAAALYTQMFARRQHASLLFAVSELVRSFGRDESCFETLRVSLEEVMSWTSKILRELSNFDAAPDVADDAFLLAKVCVSHCPSVVINIRVLPAVIDMALAGLHVQHREACCSMLIFLRNMLQARDEGSVGVLRQVLPPRGEALVRALLGGALGSLPTARLEDVTDALAAMLACAGSAAVAWVAAAVRRIPEHAASAADTAAFMAVVTACGEGAGHVRALGRSLDELSELCRRSRRTRESVQAALAATAP